jgi:hypothetical protein
LKKYFAVPFEGWIFNPNDLHPAHMTTAAGKETLMTKDKAQPAARFKLGFVTATVWKNGDFHSTVLSRSYKDGDDWKETEQLAHGDLMNAGRVLQRAEDYISRQ